MDKKDIMGYRAYSDQLAAGSGSGYGSCYCPKAEEEGNLSDLGLLAAGAAAVFLLYQAITMKAARKKRSKDDDLLIYNGADLQEFFWSGRII